MRFDIFSAYLSTFAQGAVFRPRIDFQPFSKETKLFRTKSQSLKKSLFSIYSKPFLIDLASAFEIGRGVIRREISFKNTSTWM
jgi:hypothetical protein